MQLGHRYNVGQWCVQSLGGIVENSACCAKANRSKESIPTHIDELSACGKVYIMLIILHVGYSDIIYYTQPLIWMALTILAYQ